jgi:5-(carboxyamino)imidazole ribonucleotide mutase
VATVSIGGARNAGLLAVRILATDDSALTERVLAFQRALAESARSKDAALSAQLANLGES